MRPTALDRSRRGTLLHQPAGRAVRACERNGLLEPSKWTSGDSLTPVAPDNSEERGAETVDQPSERFEATIVRLDQSAAEEIFRLATR